MSSGKLLDKDGALGSLFYTNFVSYKINDLCSGKLFQAMSCSYTSSRKCLYSYANEHDLFLSIGCRQFSDTHFLAIFCLVIKENIVGLVSNTHGNVRSLLMFAYKMKL